MDGGEGGEEDEVKKGKERRGGKTDEAEKQVVVMRQSEKNKSGTEGRR